MTVVAWDGRTLAADKRASCGNLHLTTTKLRRIGNVVVAWTGDQGAGVTLANWYEKGADPDKWPAFQADKDDWCRLIVATRDGVQYTEMKPAFVSVEDKFMAWGSGMDFAITAMHFGKSVREAVEIACLFDTSCGNGVDVEIL